jgi:hypothetical protein
LLAACLLSLLQSFWAEKCSHWIALFRSRGSMQMRTLLFCFITMTIELTQGVGSVCFTIMSFFSILSSSSFTLSLIAIGTLRGVCTTGCTVLSILIECSPFIGKWNFVFLFPKTLTLYGFLIFWLHANLVMVIPVTGRSHWNRYVRFMASNYTFGIFVLLLYMFNLANLDTRKWFWSH